MNEKHDTLSSSLSDSLLAEFKLASANVVTLNAASSIAPPPRVSSAGGPRRDWSATEQLIQEAREAMRISDERVIDLEARLAEVIKQARDDIAMLTKRAENAEQQLADAYQSLRNTEARAHDAEMWLGRIHDQVTTSFAPLVRQREQDESSSSLGGLRR